MSKAFPKTLGACLAELAKLRATIEKAEAALKPVVDRKAALCEHLLATFKKDELNGARGSNLALSIVATTVPTLADWDAFFAYARRKGNEDLLQRGVNSPAWRERANAGKVVPGVTTFTRVALRVSSVRSKPTT